MAHLQQMIFVLSCNKGILGIWFDSGPVSSVCIISCWTYLYCSLLYCLSMDNISGKCGKYKFFVKNLKMLKKCEMLTHLRLISTERFFNQKILQNHTVSVNLPLESVFLQKSWRISFVFIIIFISHKYYRQTCIKRSLWYKEKAVF